MNRSTPHLTSAGLCIGILPPRRDSQVQPMVEPELAYDRNLGYKGRVPFAKPDYSVPLMKEPKLSDIDDGLALGS